MSKRVSNKRGKHAGARSGRVRLGFYRQRRLTNVEKAMEKHRRESELGKPMDQVAMEQLRGVMAKLMPKRMERRGVR